MLTIQELSKSFRSFALDSVSFSVSNDDYFVLLGPSGAGKTVLLELIAGLLQPDAGRIWCDDIDITNVPIPSRPLGFVFQNQALFPHLSVRNNIAYGLRCMHRSHQDITHRIHQLAEEMSISHLLDHMPGSLSGGEAQRTALARALATEPRYLLLDEPLTSLDADLRLEMRTILRRLHRNGHTMVHVTHDYEEAISLATRIGILENGLIIQTGSPAEVFRNPRTPFVARFLGLRNFFSGVLKHDAGQKPGASHFVSHGLVFSILTDAPEGPGEIVIPGEAITLSTHMHETSARNIFQGTIQDIANGRAGVTVTIDIGVPLTAIITADSLDQLDLCCGKTVYASFKASAIQFIREI